MSKKTRRLIPDLGLIFFLGLAPLLWFQSGALIKGIDFDLPLTFERLKTNFFYMWDAQSGAGLPRHLHFPAILFFLPQALFHSMGFSLETVQRLFFCLWFTLPGLTFYCLMRQLVPGGDFASRAGVLAAASFYMFNLYLEPIWLGLNIANLSAYAAMPLALAVLIRALETEKDVFSTALKFGLIFAVFPSIAVNPSIVLICAVSPLLLIGIHLWRRRFAASSLKYLAALLPLSLLFVLAFNAYWILPEAINLFQAQAAFEAASMGGGNVADEVYYSTEWLRGVSRNTGLLNVLKMQGDWPWYDGFREHAQVFWKNPLWIALAWLPFSLAVLALWKSRHSWKWFFGALWMTGLFFSMGSHMPLGAIYLWMVKHVPLFWTIRSPWYKFTLLTCLGYGVLTGFAARWIVAKIREKGRRLALPLSAAGLVFFVGVNPLYAFPLVKGSMFRTAKKEGDYSNHFKIPPHVIEAAAWLNGNAKGGRLWDLPSRGISYNNWGYEGFLPLVGYFISAPIFCDSHPLHIPYQGAWSSSWTHVAKLMRNAVEKGVTPYLSNLMRMLRIDTVLLEGDFRFEVLPFPVKREEIKEKLDRLNGLAYARSFAGDWDLWKLKDPVPALYFVPGVSVVNDALEALVPLSVKMGEGKPSYLIQSQTDAGTLALLEEKGLVSEAVFFECGPADWATEGLCASYLHRFVHDPAAGKQAWLRRPIAVKEEGEYAVLARKKFPQSDTNLRVEVDFTNIPQHGEMRWNFPQPSPVPPKVRFQTAKRKIMNRVLPFTALGMTGHALWIPINLKHFFFVADVFWNRGDTGVKTAALFQVNRDSRFDNDPEIIELWKEMGSRDWQYLGNRKLPAGAAELSVSAAHRLRAQWDFYVVPRDALLQRLRRCSELFSDKSIGQTVIAATTSNWNSASGVEQKRLWIEPDGRFSIEIDPQKKKGLFPLEIYGKPYHCYAGNTLAFHVNNSSKEDVDVHLGLRYLVLNSDPRTMALRINGETVKTWLAEPMKEEKVFHKGLKLSPGNNLVEVLCWSNLSELGSLFGTEDPRKVCFAYASLDFGRVMCEQEIDIPDGREYSVRLLPLFELSGPHPSEIAVDGVSRRLVAEKVGGGGLFFRLEKKLRLTRGRARFKMEIPGKADYFILLESEPAKMEGAPAVFSGAERRSPTRAEAVFDRPAAGVLIFNEGFDSKWAARTQEGKALKQFKINGFANAFAVTEGHEGPIAIEFVPQRHFMMGLVFSASSLFLTALAALFTNRRRRRTAGFGK